MEKTVSCQPVPTIGTIKRLPKKRDRQQGRNDLRLELRNLFRGSIETSSFSALALSSGSVTLMSLR